MANKKYKVQKGDTWVGIARKFGIDDLDKLYDLNDGVRGTWRPADLQAGTEIYLPIDEQVYRDVQRRIVRRPENKKQTAQYYADLSSEDQAQVNAYAQALRDKKIKLNDIPEYYRNFANEQAIRNLTTEAVPYVLETGMAAGNLPGFALGYGLQKGLAGATNIFRDKDERYSAKELLNPFEYTPITGRQFASEHPLAAIGTDVVATVATGRGLAALKAGIQNIQNAGGIVKFVTEPRQFGSPRWVEWTEPFKPGTVPDPDAKTIVLSRTSMQPKWLKPSNGGINTMGQEIRGQIVPIVHEAVPAAEPVAGIWPTYVPLPQQTKVPYRIVEPEPQHIEWTKVYDPRLSTTGPGWSGDPWEGGQWMPVIKKEVSGTARKGSSVKEQPVNEKVIVTYNTGKESGASYAPNEDVGPWMPDIYHDYGYGNQGLVYIPARKKGGKLIPKEK